MTVDLSDRSARLTVAGGLVASARAEARAALYEHEGYALLRAFGIAAPAHRFVPAGETPADDDLAAIPGERLVVKAVGRGLLHKSDVGGVLIGPRTPAWADASVRALADRIPGLAGCLLAEFVPHDGSVGGELLASVRLTREFGPVVTLALGGTRAEFLSAHLHDDAAMAALEPGTEAAGGALDRAAVVQLLTEPMRGSPARLGRADLLSFVARLQQLAQALAVLDVLDCEINPAVVRDGQLVALDVLVTLAPPPQAVAPRPLHKLSALLRPQRLAIIGVSDQLNPGRIILRNVLRDGTHPADVTVIKPGWTEIDGCRCVPSVADLPAPVDVLVVAVGAAQAAAIVEQVVDRQLAESLIVIPGGFEEKDGSAGLAARMRSALDASRATAWGGPLLVGGNCLGVRSRPGRYDTLFIPESKLPSPPGPDAPIAVVAQSGAFAIARVSQWRLRPKYVITAGNQLDVTIGDVLSGLADDEGIELFAVYVEGFRPLDGAHALEATRRIVARGGTVVVYRAGRTPAGASASASHTASIAGDYRLTRALFTQAGAIVADTIEHFDDIVLLAAKMGARRPRGRRLAAISNAGFECVAMADSLGPLSLAAWGLDTVHRLAAELARLRVSEVVDVHNPLDLTPMTSDEGYEAVVRTVLADPGVDLAVVGCVPLTAALHTLPGGAGDHDDLHRPDGVVARLGRLWREGRIPWVAVVDSGALFDPMAAALEAEGLPVFRTADRALKALGDWATTRIDTRTAVQRPR